MKKRLPTEILNKGEWHIHTNYVDGKSSIDDICFVANNLGIPLIAFTEHVRYELTYNFNDYLNDISIAREKYPTLAIVSGIETKVLPDGTLDVANEIIDKVDYVVASIHSFSGNNNTYFSALIEMLNNPNVSTWGHPGRHELKDSLKINSEKLRYLFDLSIEKNVLIESSIIPAWYKMASDCCVRFVNANDIHSIEELLKAREMIK